MTQSSSLPRMHRPAGIWISTVYAGLVFGLLPIFYLLQNLLLSSWTTFWILPSLVTPLLIILSACLVWAGRDDARFWFLVILTLYAYATGIAIAVLLRSGFVPPPYQLPILGLVIHNFIIPPIYYVYFTRQKAFFQREE